ncbi:MAG: alanine:cation symporter family protein [Clostridium sp.]
MSPSPLCRLWLFFSLADVFYLILHADYLLPSLKLIFSSAFALPSIGGGFAGYTMGKAIRYGVARGLLQTNPDLAQPA